MDEIYTDSILGLENRSANDGSWLWILFRGLIGISFGLSALYLTEVTSLWLLSFVAIFMFIDGLLLLFHLVASNIPKGFRFAAWLRAIFSIIGGFYIIFLHPVMGTLILGASLSMMVAIQVIVIGSLDIVAGIFGTRPRILNILVGIFWVLFGGSLIQSPLESILTLTQVAGILALIFGISLVIGSFYYRNAVKYKNPPKTHKASKLPKEQPEGDEESYELPI